MAVSALEGENELLAPLVSYTRGVWHFKTLLRKYRFLEETLVDKVKSLIHEGNVRRIIIRDEHGNTFMEIPVTVAAIGAVLAPVLAALGAISALVAKFTVVVVRTEDKPPG